MNEYGESYLVELLMKSQGHLTEAIKDCIDNCPPNLRQHESAARVTPVKAAIITQNSKAIKRMQSKGFKATNDEVDFAYKSYPDTEVHLAVQRLLVHGNRQHNHSASTSNVSDIDSLTM